MPLDQPGRVVCFTEREQRLTQLLDRFEVAHPEQVLLQCADEPFGAAVAFRRADERGRAFDAEERDFLLEVVRHVLRTVIAPHREARAMSSAKPPKHRRAPWNGYSTLEVRADVHDGYNKLVDEKCRNMVWAHPGVTSWYKNRHNRVTVTSPWRLLDYWKLTQHFVPEEYRAGRPGHTPIIPGQEAAAVSSVDRLTVG